MSRCALDCCDREALHWAVTLPAASTVNGTGRHAGGGGDAASATSSGISSRVADG